MKKNEKKLLSGNEAVARGFYEAGGRVAAAYPGTPSTEILEGLCGYDGVHAEWSTNEKVALEVAAGASLAGVRAMACMKHVGVNVASDPLVTLSYTGVNAGLVLVAADDPGMFSSQNEQDTRHYARLAKVPCLEPSDSEEARGFTALALDLSEGFNTPVILRTTTRVSHSMSAVGTGRREGLPPMRVEKNFRKWVMLPSTARARHGLVEKRLKRLEAYAEEAAINRIHEGGGGLGIIASGIAYQYAREAFPDASVLKLGMTYPLPTKLIRRFAKGVKKLAVVEELDPFIEGQVRALGVKVHYGKDALPVCGEYSPGLLRERLGGTAPAAGPAIKGLPARLPALCPGCPHRGLFVVLSRLRALVSGDIGCYTLGAFPPFSALHFCVCMGASIPAAHGMSKGLAGRGARGKPVAVIGDSTFLHSGITGLINLAYNRGDALVVIMNNGTTAMTGGQDHPGTGRTAMGGRGAGLSFEAICRASGIGRVREIDTGDLKGLESIIREEMAAPGPSVLISNRPCVLGAGDAGRPAVYDRKRCRACGRCLRAGCIALALVGSGGRHMVVDPLLCTGCGVCVQLCPHGALGRAEE